MKKSFFFILLSLACIFANAQAENIELIFSNITELDGTYNLFPQQAPRLLSSKTTFTFAKDEATYRSEDESPSLNYGKITISMAAKSAVTTFWLSRHKIVSFTFRRPKTSQLRK